MRVCGRHRAGIVLQGGNTGLVGAAVPAGGEVLVSLRRLTELGDADVAAQQLTVGAGVTLAELQAHARAAGLDFGVDLAARESQLVGVVSEADLVSTRAPRQVVAVVRGVYDHSGRRRFGRRG